MAPEQKRTNLVVGGVITASIVASAGLLAVSRTGGSKDSSVIPSNYPKGVLPDPKLTPGATNPDLTQQVLLAPGFSTRTWRHVSETDKDNVYKRYGLELSPDVRKTVEVDHLIPLEVGGSNTTENPSGSDYLSNLWAEPWHVRWSPASGDSSQGSATPRSGVPQGGAGGPDQVYDLGAHTKDRVENAARKAVQDGRMTLGDVQQGFRTDWTALYHKLLGEFPKWDDQKTSSPAD